MAILDFEKNGETFYKCSICGKVSDDYEDISICQEYHSDHPYDIQFKRF